MDQLFSKTTGCAYVVGLHTNIPDDAVMTSQADILAFQAANMASALSAPKTQEQINAEARAYLASTDWYVTRLNESGAAIPDEILAERQAARDRVIE